jgi:hypothetical protein
MEKSYRDFRGLSKVLQGEQAFPTTKQGLERKVGSSILSFILSLFFGKRK